jgi:hypothetical protein
MINKVLLNNIDHHDLRVIARHGPEFGDSINQALIFPTEFEVVQREYPILFRKDVDGEFQAVVLLGLDRDENLFLENGGWQARYVPAAQRHGPFSIALNDNAAQSGPMIHVDLEHPRISRTEGENLFLPHGGNAPYLEQVTEVLRTIYLGIEANGPMFSAFAEAGLIEPVQIEIKLGDGAQYNLPQYHSISDERLAALNGSALERLHRQGFLRLAFQAAASLGNISRLIDLKNRKLEGR